MNGTCPTSGKRIFTSRGQAAQAMRVLRSGDRLRAYHCPACGCWHLTSAVGDGSADRRLSHRKAARR